MNDHAMIIGGTSGAIAISPRMRAVLRHAAELGKERIGHPFIGTEQLLRAIADDDSGIAVQVLRELGVVDRVRERLDQIIGDDAYLRSSGSPSG